MKESNKSRIGRRILMVRESAGLSQSDFASKFRGVGSSISKWERGVSAPSAEALADMCEAFDIDPRWLLFGIGDTPPGRVAPPLRGKPDWEMSNATGELQSSSQNRPANSPKLEPVQALPAVGTSSEGKERVGETLRLLETIAEESRQRWQIAVLADIRRTGGGWLKEIADRLGRPTSKVWSDVVALNRHEYLTIETRGGGYWLTPRDKRVDITGADTVDGSSITKTVIERLILDVLPKADRRDGSGGVVVAEVQSAEGRGLVRRFYEVAHRFWEEAEAEAEGGDTVTIILAAGVESGEA